MSRERNVDTCELCFKEIDLDDRNTESTYVPNLGRVHDECFLGCPKCKTITKHGELCVECAQTVAEAHTEGEL